VDDEANGWLVISHMLWVKMITTRNGVPGSKASIFFGINRKTGANSVAPLLQFDPHIPK
jgi:hypothetical protein